MTTNKPPKARFSINLAENPDNQLLLLKRSKKAKLGPGMWGFPAGHIHDKETPEDCSYREFNEEIGTNHEVSLINQIGPVRDTFYGGIYEVHLFHYRWKSGVIILNDEHTEYAWVSARDYKNYAVMDGLDEDILYLGIWPKKYLNSNRLPEHLK